MIRTLLFDLGNVLLHFSNERMCAQMGALCGKSADDIRCLLFDTGLQQHFERGAVSEDEFHRRFEQAVGAKVDLPALRLAASDIFELNTSMPPLLDTLKERGYRLVLLSNTCAAHYEFVAQSFDVLNRFDHHVVSFRVGAVKPEAAIFTAALEAIRCKPSECFYTDDIPAYVEAARRFGLQAEVFTDVATLRSHLAERGIDLPTPETDRPA
ncbi:MAG: HAD family phosphatase [Planctomycetaceae bacterium]